MKNIGFILFIFIIFTLLSCEKKECTWDLINDVQVGNSTKNTLNSIFSVDNYTLKAIDGDALVFLINNEKDLQKIYRNDINFDFSNLCIVGGRFGTASISDSIQEVNLFDCTTIRKYKCEVKVAKCTECWAAIGNLYFWKVYPKNKNKEISLIIKK